MDSSTHKSREQDAKQADIRAKIAALQAQLETGDISDAPPPEPRDKGKRKAEPPSDVLAPSTPSPKKRIKRDVTQKPLHASSISSRALQPTRPLPNPASRPSASNSTLASKPPPAPSGLVHKLAALSKPSARPAAPTRSAAFAEPAPFPDILPVPNRTHQDATPDDHGRCQVQRDDNLALIETLEPEPTCEHKPPPGDPDFRTLEPHSGIRLATRALSHEDLAEHLCGRFLLPPSLLYSVARVSPNKAGYDVPVPGDWVVIAVVAERGPVRQSKAPVGIEKDDRAGEEEEGLGKDLGAGRIQIQAPKPGNVKNAKGKGVLERKSGKKYVSLKLIDFGARGAASSNAKAVIRGDAMLTLLLFEADAVEEGVDDEGKRTRAYRGGSRGAFEKMAKLKEGAVVALLNPRVLKPFSRPNAGVADNVLALTPESAESVAVIGTARDLGMCQVLKRDGKVCGGWVDKRVSEVCEWHVQHAVKARRAGRAEFSIGTSGLTQSAVRKRDPKTEYDPRRQWGLKPEGQASATYVVAGHVVGGGGAKGMFVEERLGREVQAKAARVTKGKEEERTLKMLLGRDREGMRAVIAAREAEAKAEASARKKAGKKDKTKAKEEEQQQQERRGYSASMVKQLGFDPTGKSGRVQEKGVEDKLKTLMAVRSARGPVGDAELALRPGKRRSGVHKPATPATATSLSCANATTTTSVDARRLSTSSAASEIDLDADSDSEPPARTWDVADLGSDEDEGLYLDFPDSDEEGAGEKGFGRPGALLAGEEGEGDGESAETRETGETRETRDDVEMDGGMVDLDSED